MNSIYFRYTHLRSIIRRFACCLSISGIVLSGVVYAAPSAISRPNPLLHGKNAIRQLSHTHEFRSVSRSLLRCQKEITAYDQKQNRYWFERKSSTLPLSKHLNGFTLHLGLLQEKDPAYLAALGDRLHTIHVECGATLQVMRSTKSAIEIDAAFQDLVNHPASFSRENTNHSYAPSAWDLIAVGTAENVQPCINAAASHFTDRVISLIEGAGDLVVNNTFKLIDNTRAGLTNWRHQNPDRNGYTDSLATALADAFFLNSSLANTAYDYQTGKRNLWNELTTGPGVLWAMVRHYVAQEKDAFFSKGPQEQSAQLCGYVGKVGPELIAATVLLRASRAAAAPDEIAQANNVIATSPAATGTDAAGAAAKAVEPIDIGPWQAVEPTPVGSTAGAPVAAPMAAEDVVLTPVPGVAAADVSAVAITPVPGVAAADLSAVAVTPVPAVVAADLSAVAVTPVPGVVAADLSAVAVTPVPTIAAANLPSVEIAITPVPLPPPVHATAAATVPASPTSAGIAMDAAAQTAHEARLLRIEAQLAEEAAAEAAAEVANEAHTAHAATEAARTAAAAEQAAQEAARLAAERAEAERLAQQVAQKNARTKEKIDAAKAKYAADRQARIEAEQAQRGAEQARIEEIQAQLAAARAHSARLAQANAEIAEEKRLEHAARLGRIAELRTELFQRHLESIKKTMTCIELGSALLRSLARFQNEGSDPITGETYAKIIRRTHFKRARQLKCP